MQSSPAQSLLPVSVVIPTHNRRTFITDAIASVENQSCRPTELIIVDDGSTDDTTEALRGLGCLVLRQEHRGIGAARNQGIAVATQPWIAFLDDDDVWLPQKLERQWQAAQACQQAGFIFTDIVSFSAKGTDSRSLFEARPDYRELDRISAAPGIACFNRQTLVQTLSGFSDNFMMPSTLFVRKNLLAEAGAFDTSLDSLETRELLLRLLRLADAAAVEEPLVRYRVHEGQAIRDVGRNLLALAAIVDRVCQNPQSYPDVVVASLATSRSQRHYLAGRYLFSVRRFFDAKSSFRNSLQAHHALKPLLYYCCAAFLSSRIGLALWSAIRRCRRWITHGLVAAIL